MKTLARVFIYTDRRAVQQWGNFASTLLSARLIELLRVNVP
jgi:hypothetical protein